MTRPEKKGSTKGWMQLRVEKTQYAKWKRAAAADDRSLSAWVRRLLDAAATDQLAKAKAVKS